MKDSQPPNPQPALPATDAADIAQSLEPLAPGADRAVQLKARILRGAGDNESRSESPPRGAPRLRTVTTSARKWTRFTPGVDICVLHEDDQRRTALFRMQPGSVLFAHHHDMSEESLVLEGAAVVGDDLQIAAGDYQFAPAGTQHPPISSPTGCTVLVHGERRPRVQVNVALLTRLVHFFAPSTRTTDR